MDLTVQTDTASGSGTDGDVLANVSCRNGAQSGWQELDKPHYDDFEAGDKDTYRLPLNGCSDVDYVEFKLRAGNILTYRDYWKLYGVWAETDSHATYYGDTPAQVGEKRHPWIYPNVWNSTDIVMSRVR
ncbi:PLAT/LH2 domain-containing protein [Streptomyces monomycini]|uniref:PLAT/LH2 domain-containing protein n=1 Tax=Streptomyces monomycini TaxID=371720 RepID=UPI0012FED2FB|nr:PLAT/LH2 domain-containing protein [Streptomyces monomycini]